MSQELTESLEDYLEAIYHIAASKQAARPKDIGERMGVQGSSVTGALQALAARKLVNYAPYDIVTLTKGGRRVAREIVNRHEALRDFFVGVLGVGEAVAEEGACRMEHAVPREIFERFSAFADFVRRSPEGAIQWSDETGFFFAREAGDGDEG